MNELAAPLGGVTHVSENDVRIGVALGGGSARGYAHIGALASLERHGCAPDVLVGTSFGAVVGALYATGRGVDELCDQARRMRRRDVFPHVADFGLHRAALFRGRKLQEYFARLLDGRHFEDLERELVVVTTDIDSGERILLSSGPLDIALRASASLPGIFAPVEVGGRRLIDGGIGSPVPLDTLLGMDVDLAIGIGAGMQARDSRSIRAARRLVASPRLRRAHDKALSSAPRHAVGRLGRAIAIAAQNWIADDSLEGAAPLAGAGRGGSGERGYAERSRGSLEVHTHPPIHWLNFHRAGEAIDAGDAALSALMPRVRGAIAGVLAARAALVPTAVATALGTTVTAALANTGD